MLTDIYSDTALSHADIFKLHKRKLGGLGDQQNDPKYGWPQTTKTNDNIIKCEICCTVMADTLNMNKKSIHKVLSNDLDTRKIHIFWPKLSWVSQYDCKTKRQSL